MGRVLLAAATLLLLGCPAKGGKQERPAKTCSAFGASCEFAPGKLGTCVIRDNCSDTNCYVCQSQH
jgi:hypothetical protein